MAATDPRWGSVVAAALLLPGIATTAHAETAPEQGVVELKYLSYRDWQPDFSRIRVSTPAVYVLAPIGSRWSVEGSMVSDAVSGASPRYHTAVSGASRLSERRNAEDVSVTHYDERSAWSLGAAYSDEHDYTSHTVSGTWRWSTPDNNRTWNVGLGYDDDDVGSSDDPTLHGHRRTWRTSFGVRANTFDAAWVQSFGDRVQLTPSLRYTSQRAARFYYDPVYSATLGAPFPPGYDGQHAVSADQRLSAFGAITAGLRLDVKLAPRWTMDLSVERYAQRGGWRLGGDGSPGLAPFYAQWFELGVARSF